MFAASALTLWAHEVYGFLDPGYTGRLPSSAMEKFSPREFDALSVVQRLVGNWRAAQTAQKTSK